MWQQMTEDGHGGGGGFDNSTQFQNSFTGGEEKKHSRADTLIPVTVRQVLESSDTTIKIGHVEVEKSMLKLVGIVKSVEISSIKIVFTVEDNTGSVTGIFWISGEESGPVPVVENTYCSMYGTIRTQAGSKYFLVINIQPVVDLNEITSHMLEVIYISLRAENMDEQDAQPSIKHEMASSYGNQSEKFTNNFGLDLQQQKVYKAISQCPEEGGATVEYITSVLTTKMPPKEISKIIEFLVNEGHVYSSIDDFHFKSTESTSFD